ncbi:MAG: RNA-binding protein [Patescibacteria group bacterium]|jgi:RNA recognition motif-containing protein
MNKKLFVGSLPVDTNNSELKALFTKAGSVRSVKIATRRYSNKPSGYAYIDMSTEKDAKKAIQMFHGFKLRDMSLTVYEAKVEKVELA